MQKEEFRKKILFPLCYLMVLGLAIMGGNNLINTVNNGNYALIETAAGEEIDKSTPQPPTIPMVDATILADSTIIPAINNNEDAPIKISPDKPEIIHLKKDVVNVLVGSDENLRAIPDTNRTIILIPKKPGSTYFKAIDSNGEIIMQRYVIIAAPEEKSKYVRIRRTCAAGDSNCKEYSVYYCPDICHEVNVVQGEKTSAPIALPNDVASTPGIITNSTSNNTNTNINPDTAIKSE